MCQYLKLPIYKDDTFKKKPPMRWAEHSSCRTLTLLQLEHCVIPYSPGTVSFLTAPCSHFKSQCEISSQYTNSTPTCTVSWLLRTRLVQPFKAFKRPGVWEAHGVILWLLRGLSWRGEVLGAAPRWRQRVGRQDEGPLVGSSTLWGWRVFCLSANTSLGLAGKIQAGTNWAK